MAMAAYQHLPRSFMVAREKKERREARREICSELGFLRAPASIGRTMEHLVAKKLFLSGSDRQREPESRELLRARASIRRNLKHFMPKKIKAWICASSSFDQQKREAFHAKEDQSLDCASSSFNQQKSEASHAKEAQSLDLCELELRSAGI
jgi:hypothetical protein